MWEVREMCNKCHLRQVSMCSEYEPKLRGIRHLVWTGKSPEDWVQRIIHTYVTVRHSRSPTTHPND